MLLGAVVSQLSEPGEIVDTLDPVVIKELLGMCRCGMCRGVGAECAEGPVRNKGVKNGCASNLVCVTVAE